MRAYRFGGRRLHKALGNKHSFSKKTAWLVKHEQGGVTHFSFSFFFLLIEGKLTDKHTTFKDVGTKKSFFPQICWVLSKYNSFHYMYFPNSVG